MQIDLSRFRETFFEEAAEHLADMEAGLLQLEVTPDNGDLLNAIFRGAHSIKGASGTFGFPDIADFTHALESLLDQMRDGSIRPSRDLINLLLRSTDILTGLVATAKTGQAAPAATSIVLTELKHALQVKAPSEAAPLPATKPMSGTATYQIEFAPGQDLFRQGMDPLLVLRDLERLGTLSEVRADLTQLPPLIELDPESCYLAWSVRLITEKPLAEIEDVFAFVRDSSRIGIERVPDVEPTSDESSTAKVATPAGARTDFHGRALDCSSIRVAIDKIDKLVNLVEELVVTQSMLNQAAGTFTLEKLPFLQEAVATMERNLRELQERVMAVRMVPVSSISGRFPRLVRELAAALGKQVAFEMVGQETELDKQVIERIGDPLTHLLRNAIDHGIEPPAERLAQGKPAEGTIRLAASHRGDNVVLEVSDDGRGLDTERIRHKGIAQGLLRADDDRSEAEVHALIFHPGFSTAATVSAVSGRGVGMDVVKRNIEGLNGTVTITSTPGRGTCLRIQLPLTLAILDGLCVGLRDEVYIVPLLSIIESLQPRPETIKRVLGKGEVVVMRGETVPLFRLNRLLGTSARVTNPCQGLVVIVEGQGKKLGLLVDELLGQSQVVIKNLEVNYRKVEGIAGATILGDGRVALILDVHGLTRLAAQQRNFADEVEEDGARALRA